MSLLLVLLLACSRPDPQLQPVRDALDAWVAGSEALEAGDSATALTKFREARGHRPDDLLLAAWEAQALAESGEVEAAIALLDEVLAEEPGFSEARYNRAAYKARLDYPEAEIARDLKRAIDEGVARSRDVLSDPDFATYLGQPEFSFLPDEELTVAVEAPTGTVFWGSEFNVRFRIAGAGDDPIGITAEDVAGPVRLVSVVDDSNPSTDGIFRDLTWTFRVEGAGTVHFGPWHAWAGDRRAVLDPVTLVAAAPDDRSVPVAPLPIEFHTPQELRGRAELPSARVVSGALLVVYEPGDRVVLEPVPDAEPVRYEVRTRGRTEWTLDRYPGVGPGDVHVRILRGGHAVFDGNATGGV